MPTWTSLLWPPPPGIPDTEVAGPAGLRPADVSDEELVGRAAGDLRQEPSRATTVALVVLSMTWWWLLRPEPNDPCWLIRATTASR